MKVTNGKQQFTIEKLDMVALNVLKKSAKRKILNFKDKRHKYVTVFVTLSHCIPIYFIFKQRLENVAFSRRCFYLLRSFGALCNFHSNIMLFFPFCIFAILKLALSQFSIVLSFIPSQAKFLIHFYDN